MSDDKQEQEQEHEGTEKVRAQVDDMLDELQKSADEIRVKIHLGSMEAKDQWKELEPKLQELEKGAEKIVERTGEELKSIGADLRSRFKKLKDDLGA